MFAKEKSTEIYPSKMIVESNYLPIKYNDIISLTDGGTIIILLNYYDSLIDNYTEKQLVFKMKAENDKIKLYKGSFISNALKDYLEKNHISLKNI